MGSAWDFNPRRRRGYEDVYDDEGGAPVGLNERVEGMMAVHRIHEIQHAITNIQQDLQGFENQYGMTTESFYRRFRDGDMGDDEDYMIWSGLYEILLENRGQLEMMGRP